MHSSVRTSVSSNLVEGGAVRVQITITRMQLRMIEGVLDIRFSASDITSVDRRSRPLKRRAPTRPAR